MRIFKHVSRINVSLWGQRVGTIVEAPQRGVYAFRYGLKGSDMIATVNCHSSADYLI